MTSATTIAITVTTIVIVENRVVTIVKKIDTHEFTTEYRLYICVNQPIIFVRLGSGLCKQLNR